MKKPYTKPRNIYVAIVDKGKPVSEPIPDATIMFKKMEILSPVVVSPSGQERRRQRRELKRKTKQI